MKKINLTIPKPCHENWYQMTHSEKGRFCHSCQKTVIDFTNMSDRQLLDYFMNHSGSVCGRMLSDQLNRDVLIPKKPSSWIGYVVKFSLPALLLSIKSSAQKCISSISKTEINYSQVQGAVVMVKPDNLKDSSIKSIKGKVSTESGEPIPFATVMVKGTHIGVSCDEKGCFEINTGKVGKTSLVISAIGFESKEVNSDNSISNVSLVQLSGMLSGEVIVVGAIRRKPPKSIPLIKRIDTAFQHFSVYPNPVKAGASITINMNKMKVGNFEVAIINSNGLLLQNTEVITESKSQTVEISLNNLSAGGYYVRLTNKKSGKAYTEKILVE